MCSCPLVSRKLFPSNYLPFLAFSIFSPLLLLLQRSLEHEGRVMCYGVPTQSQTLPVSYSVCSPVGGGRSSGSIPIYSAIPAGSFSDEYGEIRGSMGRVTKLSCIALFNPGILESCARMLRLYPHVLTNVLYN